MAGQQPKGTIEPVDESRFNKEWAADILYKCMKGLGTDELGIIDILTMHSNSQIQLIKEFYKTAYGQDLEADLKSDLSGDFKRAIVGRICPTRLFFARELRKAMKGLGTNEAVLIDILCSATNKQVNEIKETYKAEFGRDLEADVTSECSGHLKRILVSQVQANREESNDVDEGLARQEAQELYDAGEGRWGTDECVFNRILSTRSFRHLRHTFEQYKAISEKPITEAIESETSGDLQRAYLAIAKFAMSPIFFFAEKFHEALAGVGTDEDALTRLVLTHCEVDIVKIKAAFRKQYDKSLSEWIDEDTSGDYGTFMTRLVTPNYSTI